MMKVSQSPTSIKLLLLALGFRLGMAGLLAYVYRVVYPQSDPIGHFTTAGGLWQLAWDEPATFWRILGMYEPRAAPDFAALYARLGHQLPYLHEGHALQLAKLALPCWLLGGGSFLGSGLLLSLVAFAGAWGLYRALVRRRPELAPYWAAALLFLPSVTFWSAGWLKESFALGALLGLLAVLLEAEASVHSRNPSRGALVRLACYGLACTGVLLLVKPYLLAVLLAAGSFAPVLGLVRRRLPLGRLRLPLLLTGWLVWCSLGLWGMLRFYPWYLQRALIAREDYLRPDVMGSPVLRDLGPFHLTVPGFWAQAPAALWNALAFPLPWEAHHGWSLVAGLENLALLAVLLLLGFRALRRPKQDGTRGWHVFWLSFALLYLIMLGLSVPNAGSLVRYRVYALPPLLIGLLWSWAGPSAAREKDTAV